MTTNSGTVLRVLLRNVVRGVLPYPDAFQRCRVRRAAFRMVGGKAWPGDDATPIELSELSLIRALWLQREVHSALRWRQREASALLARSAVENCIVGLYCLHANDPMSELRGQNAELVRGLFRYLLDAGVINQRMMRILMDEVAGTTRPRVLRIGTLAEEVATRSDDPLTRDLYLRLYAPLSTFFAHANGIAFLRHVRRGNVRRKPMYPWLRRSPARTADACVGILAYEIAMRRGVEAERFRRYARGHIDRSITPLPVAAGREMRSSLKWRLLPEVILEIWKARRYFETQGQQASRDDQAARLRASLGKVIGVLNTDISEETEELLIDEMSDHLVGEERTVD